MPIPENMKLDTPPPELARAVGEQPKLPDIQSPEAKEATERSFTFRMKLKGARELLSSIRASVDRIQEFEPFLLDPSGDATYRDLLQILQDQQEVLERVGKVLDHAHATVKGAAPKKYSPLVYVNKEEWHIQRAFSYPDPTDPLHQRTITYGPGEPVPPNLTLKDAYALWATDNLRKFNREQGISEVHPKTVELSRAECLRILETGVAYLRTFMKSRYVSLDSLVRLRSLAEETHQPKHLKDEIDQLIHKRTGK